MSAPPEAGNWKSHRSQEQRASAQEPPRAGVLAFFALESEEKNPSGPAEQVRGPRLPSLQAWPSPTPGKDSFLLVWGGLGVCLEKAGAGGREGGSQHVQILSQGQRNHSTPSHPL